MGGVRMLRAGERGLVVEFGDRIDPAINARVVDLGRRLARAGLPGVEELVPTYRSLLVHFDPLVLPRAALEAALRPLIEEGVSTTENDVAGRLLTVPVCYGGDFGPDLPFVAERSGLAPGEVIRLHAGATYRVYMLGFLPGFPYLGGLPSALATPRLDSPRARVPAGSVGIAGDQTGIYPFESPGGWRLIGRSPLFVGWTVGAGEPPFAAGDRVRFLPVTPGDYEEMARAKAGSSAGTRA